MKLQYTFDSLDDMDTIVDGVIRMRDNWIEKRLNGYLNKIDSINDKLNFIDDIKEGHVNPRVAASGCVIYGGEVVGVAFQGEFDDAETASAAYEKFKAETDSNKFIPGALCKSEPDLTFINDDNGVRVSLDEEDQLKMQFDDLWDEYNKFKESIPVDYWG